MERFQLVLKMVELRLADLAYDLKKKLEH